MRRVITALVLVPLVTGVVFITPHTVVVLGLMLTALMCLREFFNIIELGDVRPLRFVGYVSTAVLVSVTGLPQPDFFCVVAVLMLLAAFVLRRPMIGKTAGGTFLGVIYVGGAFTLARELHAISPHWLFWVLCLNWVGDSAAYYVGRSFGRHRLAPRVSPNKTWEGSLASVVAATATGITYLTYFVLEPSMGVSSTALLAVTVNIAGQIGDLAESLLKRSAGLKDSGDMLPGHGGILDRVDGILLSVPVLFLAIKLFGVQ